MGIIKRVLGGNPKSEPGEGTADAFLIDAVIEAYELPAGSLVTVAGESHYQDTLRSLPAITSNVDAFVEVLERSGSASRQLAEEILEETGDHKRWFWAVLLPEPSNAYDANAIAVLADGALPESQIGYLRRDEAVEYAQVFQALRERRWSMATVPAILTGGTPEKPMFGALLLLSQPSHCMAQIEQS